MRGSSPVQGTMIFFIGCLVACAQCGLDNKQMVVKPWMGLRLTIKIRKKRRSFILMILVNWKMRKNRTEIVVLVRDPHQSVRN